MVLAKNRRENSDRPKQAAANAHFNTKKRIDIDEKPKEIEEGQAGEEKP